MINVEVWLKDVSGRFAARYRDDIRALLASIANQDKGAQMAAREALGQTLIETMGAGEAIGATLALQEISQIVTTGPDAAYFNFQAHARSLIAFANDQPRGLEFTEAIEDLATRVPKVLQPAAARTAERIAALYSQDRVMAFVRSAEMSVTKRVQEVFATAMREGVAERSIGERIRKALSEMGKRTEAWTDAYSKMAFRTNLNTAVTAGRFRQMSQPLIQKVTPAFRFDAVPDGDVRHNHVAANGKIFRVQNPVWNKIAPPLGYNCRCQVSPVTRPVLRRLGRLSSSGDVIEDSLPSAAGPDQGFRHSGRPDLFITGQ